MGASEGASGTSTGGVSSGDNAQTLTAMANAAIVSQFARESKSFFGRFCCGCRSFSHRFSK